MGDLVTWYKFAFADSAAITLYNEPRIIYMFIYLFRLDNFGGVTSTIVSN